MNGLLELMRIHLRQRQGNVLTLEEKEKVAQMEVGLPLR